MIKNMRDCHYPIYFGTASSRMGNHFEIIYIYITRLFKAVIIQRKIDLQGKFMAEEDRKDDLVINIFLAAAH